MDRVDPDQRFASQGPRASTDLRDRWGVPIKAHDATAVSLLDQAVEDLVALTGDPMGGSEAAAAIDDSLVLAQVYQAYLHLYATTRTGLVAAASILDGLDVAAGPRPTGREGLHRQAARAWADGDWEAAARSLGAALDLHPRDLLALKVAQDLHFFLGHTLELRGVAERVLDAWPSDQPGWGWVQGIYAFGLEETAHYLDAETAARAALADDPHDVWATHALAHVFEMEGRPGDGAAFLIESAPDWSGSFFAVHNWWHRALYHLELDRTDEVLALFDGPIRGARSAEWLDLVDACSLLWRLSLFGVDLGARAAQLADDVAPVVAERGAGSIYAFNDWHAAMAFGLAGDREANRGLLATDRHHAVGTNRQVLDGAGLALIEAFAALAAGEADRSVELLVAVEPVAHAVGGSHAQRDVIELTLIAAATRTGQWSLVDDLVARRLARKPAAAAAVRRLVAANRR
jgi:hypothetical protein